MSEQERPSAEPSPAAAAADKKKTRRTWKQRLKLIGLVILICVLLFRVALNLLLPSVIRRVANAYDLDCSFGRIELSMLDGNAHIWNLTLRPKGGGEAILDTDYLQGNISNFALLRGRLVCYRAEADGVNILIDRDADGSVPLLKRLASARPASHSNGPAPRSAGKPVDLSAPLRVDAIRLSHVTARLRDRSVAPVFETTVKTTLRLSNVGSDQRPTQFELQVTADPVLDTLLVEGEAHNTPTSIDAQVNVILRGLHPKPAAAYLAPLGLKPVADNITVRARLNCQAAAIPNSSDLSAEIVLEAISAQADSHAWASLNKLTLNAKRVNSTTIELGKLLMEGGEASASRTPEGGLRFAGLELAPVAAPQTARPAGSSWFTSFPNLRISLDEIDFKHLAARFEDQGVSPAGQIAANLDDLSIKNIVIDPGHPDEKATLAGAASVPGVVGSIQLTGSAVPFAVRKHLNLKLVADGIRPDALEPYLALVGLESELKGGRFTSELDATAQVEPDGTLSTNIDVTGISFSDGHELLAVKTATIDRLGINPTSGAIKVASIQFNGPTLMIRRESSGSLGALGLRTRIGPSPHPATASETHVRSPSTAPTTLPSLAILPRIELGKFSWKEIKLQFTDEMVQPKPATVVGEAGIEVTNLIIDAQAKSQAVPGKLNAWISMPMIADRLAVEGTLTPAAQRLGIEASVTGTGITAKAIAPYLSQKLGMQPVLEAGQLQARAKADLSLLDGTLAASFDIEDVAYKDGATELAAVDAVRVSKVRFKPSGVEIGQVQVDRPRAGLAHNADGSFQAGGIRFAAKPATPPSAPPTLPLTRTEGSAPDPEAGAFALPSSPVRLSVAGFHLRDGSLAWTDRATATPINTSVLASVDIDKVMIGAPGSDPASLRASAQIAGVVDSATVTGTIGFSPDAPSARLDFVADGIRAGDLAAYLPPGIVSMLKSGHASGSIDAGVSNNPAGGLAAHLAIHDVDVSDGLSLLKLESLRLSASRIDPVGGLIVIDEISSAGLQSDVTLGADGVITACGIRRTSAAPATRPTGQVAIARVPGTSSGVNALPSTAPAPGVPSVSGARSPSTPALAISPQPVTDVAALVAAARKPLPLLSIETLKLGIKRLTIAGIVQPDGAPVSLNDVEVRNDGWIEIGGADGKPRPVKIVATGAVAPLVGGFNVNLRADPMAVAPTLSLDLVAKNISGKGLTELVPQLTPTVVGTSLTQGVFRAHLDSSINYSRRGPRDLDLMRGFTLDCDIKPMEFRSVPDGPVIGGLEEIRSDGIQVEPATGNVHIKAIEITKPIGRISRDKQGIRAFGVLVPIDTAQTGPASQPSAIQKPTQITVALKQSSVAAKPAQRPTNVLRLDRLTVTGADVIVADQTATPVTIIPLNGLDVDVRDVSNQMPYDAKPMRFSMLATSDKVPLPMRTKGNASRGSSTRNADGSYSEMRELFSQVTANGVVAIKQAGDHFVLDGWAKTSVNGFELLGLRGMARQYDVTIGGGIFDDSNTIRFNPAGNIETQNRVVVTNLSLAEPPNGPIQRALKITAPIDVAVGLITDPDGSITLNLPVGVKNGAISTSDVVGPALGAVGGVLVTAIASAPVKAIGGIGNLIGLKADKAPAPEQRIVIRFLPGYTGLDPAGAASLQALVARMRKDPKIELQVRPELSAADVARAGIRANPDPGDSRTLAEQFRRQKAELMARRAVLTGKARGELGSQPESEARSTLASLKSVDRQVAQIENSLDQLYDLLRPGADRQADRRTRAASLAITAQRLTGVHAALLAGAIRGADQRIHQSNPQFIVNESAEGGEVVITVISKKS